MILWDEQNPAVKFRLEFVFWLQKLGFLGRLWTDLATIFWDLQLYKISANLVHRELRNATFVGKKCQLQLHFRTVDMRLLHVFVRLKCCPMTYRVTRPWWFGSGTNT